MGLTFQRSVNLEEHFRTVHCVTSVQWEKKTRFNACESNRQIGNAWLTLPLLTRDNRIGEFTNIYGRSLTNILIL